MTLDEMRKKMEEAKKEVEKYGKEALSEEFAKFFEANPSVIAVRWEQFTPYFNDGEACEFSVREPAVKIEGMPDDVGEAEDGFMNSYDFDYEFRKGGPHVDHPKAQEFLALKKPLTALGNTICASAVEDVFLATFGDHVQVTATRKGSKINFEVDDYDHE